MKPVAATTPSRVWLLVLSLILVVQSLMVVTLWQRLNAVQAERATAERILIAARQRAEAERATLVARLRAAEARVAEFAPPVQPVDAPPAGSILLERTLESQVAFTYGTPQEAGRYVGQTLQRLFAARKLQTPEEIEQSLR